MAITSLVVFKIASEQKKYVAKVSPAQVHDMQGITTAECMVCGNNFHLANPSVLVSWFPSWLVLANILLLFWLTSVICTMTIDWRDNVITVLQGSVPFFIGLFLLFVRWPVAGIIMELYGSFVLFSGYGPPIQAFLYQIPIIGWILQYPFQLFAQLRRKRAWNLLQLPRYSLTLHGKSSVLLWCWYKNHLDPSLLHWNDLSNLVCICILCGF